MPTPDDFDLRLRAAHHEHGLVGIIKWIASEAAGSSADEVAEMAQAVERLNARIKAGEPVEDDREPCEVVELFPKG